LRELVAALGDPSIASRKSVLLAGKHIHKVKKVQTRPSYERTRHITVTSQSGYRKRNSKVSKVSKSDLEEEMGESDSFKVRLKEASKTILLLASGNEEGQSRKRSQRAKSFHTTHHASLDGNDVPGGKGQAQAPGSGPQGGPGNVEKYGS
jgi:hypothetical protein